jgi:hypothetical protein
MAFVQLMSRQSVNGVRDSGPQTPPLGSSHITIRIDCANNEWDRDTSITISGEIRESFDGGTTWQHAASIDRNAGSRNPTLGTLPELGVNYPQVQANSQYRLIGRLTTSAPITMGLLVEIA